MRVFSRNSFIIDCHYYIENERRRLFFFLVLSLFLHLLLIVSSLILRIQFPTLFDPSSEMPAALKPRQSEFGTVVMFDTITMREEELPHDFPELPVAQAMQQKVVHETVEEDLKKESEAIQDTLSESVKQDKLEKKVDAAVEQVHHEPEVSPAIHPDDIPVQQDVKERLAEIARKQSQLGFYEKQQQVKKQQNEPVVFTKAKKQEPQTAQPSKEKRNLFTMTKGFIENLKNEGDDWLERKGDESKRPSFEELKYLAYEQKITWQLQSAWNRHFSRHCKDSFEGKVIGVDFSIAASGTLQKCILLQSSGTKELDDMILESIRLAAPYPPLPKHFGTECYKTGRLFHVCSRLFRFYS